MRGHLERGLSPAPANELGERLRCPVDTDGDSDNSDETTLLNDTSVIDGTWTAGYVGLFRLSGYAVTHQFDDVTVWLDTNGDGILDSGEAVQAADNFNSNQLSLSYDNNGNLTSDGLYQYVYDAWNRLVRAQRKAAHAGQSDDVTTIGEYKYLPDNRRASKVVSNCGVEQTAADGGNTTVHFYYSNKWQILETRNGSNQATRQWVYGTGGPDDLVFLDVNGDPGNSNDCNPDVTAQGESGQDRRYVYQQDRNPSVMVLLETDDGAGTAGRAVERYGYEPYGQFLVLKGDAGSGELGSVRLTSNVGNPFTHQGLFFDAETGSFQNRYRQRGTTGWYQRDPLGYRAGPNLHGYLGANPVNATDPAGLMKATGCGAEPAWQLASSAPSLLDEDTQTYCTRICLQLDKSYPGAFGPCMGGCTDGENGYNCENGCNNAYPKDSPNWQACLLGCRSARPPRPAPGRPAPPVPITCWGACAYCGACLGTIELAPLQVVSCASACAYCVSCILDQL